MKFGIRRAVTLPVALLAAPSIVWGQAWPTKPVKIVAPFAAGENVGVTAL
jgi:tripartite-type tricarboxylate transporter receptor subunit TctC